MKRAICLATALAGLGLATAASAADYEILILPNTYFPETTYLDPGDSVVFVNTSGDEHTIVADNEAWTIGPLQPGETYSLVIDSEIERTFHNANVINSDGTFAVTGDISFEEGPVE